MQWFYRFLILTVTLVVFFGQAAQATHARSLCPSGYTQLCNIKIGEDAGGIVGFIMVVLFIIAIITSLFFLIYGAFRWVTSAGDQNKTTQARQTIIAAIVGLVISLLTFFIVNTVIYFFTGSGFGDLNNINIKL
jgi:hypothetical protein